MQYVRAIWSNTTEFIYTPCIL